MNPNLQKQAMTYAWKVYQARNAGNEAEAKSVMDRFWGAFHALKVLNDALASNYFSAFSDFWFLLIEGKTTGVEL